MTKLVFHAGGQAIEVEGEDGDSVMFAAVRNGVPGIIAECGGVLSCATCHVYVDAGWIGRLEPPSDEESDMLDATEAKRAEGSRLSCQIEIAPALNGLTMRVPDEQ